MSEANSIVYTLIDHNPSRIVAIVTIQQAVVPLLRLPRARLLLSQHWTPLPPIWDSRVRSLPNSWRTVHPAGIVPIIGSRTALAFAARVNKIDVHDAEGLAQLARTGWFKRVHMNASATHIDRAALRIRAQLINARVATWNQLRGLLKLFGSRLPPHTPGRCRERLVALYQQRPDLEPLFAPLVASIEVIEDQLRASCRLLESRATDDPVCGRLMSVPGVGPITALTFTATIEDPVASPVVKMSEPIPD